MNLYTPKDALAYLQLIGLEPTKSSVLSALVELKSDLSSGFIPETDRMAIENRYQEIKTAGDTLGLIGLW